MITSLDISNYRGIVSGKLEGLAPLTILLGPNGAGKSTVLEAMAIAADANPVKAIGAAVRRRPNAPHGGEFLLPRGARAASFSLLATGGATRQIFVTASDAGEGQLPRAEFLVEGRGRESSEEKAWGRSLGSITLIDPERDLLGSMTHSPFWVTRLIEPGPTNSQTLAESFTTARRAGKKADVLAAARAILGDQLQDIVIDSLSGKTYVALEYLQGSVPVAVSGDGVQAFLGLQLALSGLPDDGVALLEEPEVHAHGRTLIQIAGAMWLAVERGVQVLVATQSLELVDALLDGPAAKRLGDVAVFRMALRDGQLIAHRVPGGEAAARREDYEEDLR